MVLVQEVGPPRDAARRGRYRLLVLDRLRLTRDCLVAAFASEAERIDVRAAADPEEVQLLAGAEDQADAALVNLGADDFDEAALASLRDRLRAVLPTGAMVLMTEQVDAAHLQAAARQGIRGVLHGSTTMETTRDVVALVAQGWMVFPPEAASESQIDTFLFGRPSLPAPRFDLTPRRREVLEGVTQGLTNRAIANQLGISERAVKLHIQKLMRSMGVNNRTQIVARLAGVGD